MGDRIVPPIPFPLAPSPVLPANDTRPALVLAPPPGKGKAHSRSVQHKRGDAGERLVRALNRHCYTAGVAWLRKVGEPIKIVGERKKNGTYPAVFMGGAESESGVDYLGGLLRAAAPVAVEAKVCGERRFDLRARMTDPEIRELNLYTLMPGGVAVLLVLYGPAMTVCAVPWHAVCTVRGAHDSEFAPGTLGPDDLLPHAVPAGEPYLRRFERAALGRGAR